MENFYGTIREHTVTKHCFHSNLLSAIILQMPVQTAGGALRDLPRKRVASLKKRKVEKLRPQPHSGISGG
jgi:hypothetical protein